MNARTHILSQYIPYNLPILVEKNLRTLHCVHLDEESWGYTDNIIPVLKHMDLLTREELEEAGFKSQIDYLTEERDHWIQYYGIEFYIDKINYGHMQYLLKNHYDIFYLLDSSKDN